MQYVKLYILTLPSYAPNIGEKTTKWMLEYNQYGWLDCKLIADGCTDVWQHYNQHVTVTNAH